MVSENIIWEFRIGRDQKADVGKAPGDLSTCVCQVHAQDAMPYLVMTSNSSSGSLSSLPLLSIPKVSQLSIIFAMEVSAASQEAPCLQATLTHSSPSWSVKVMATPTGSLLRLMQGFS